MIINLEGIQYAYLALILLLRRMILNFGREYCHPPNICEPISTYLLIHLQKCSQLESQVRRD